MKRVLLLTYYFPPCGGIGIIRPLKLVKYLREYGWEPVVYVPEGAQYPSHDPSGAVEIPEGVEILRHPIVEPHNFYKFFAGKRKEANVNNTLVVEDPADNWRRRLAIWVRSNFFIPDARTLWIRPSVRFLSGYLAQNPVEAIISTGPPHSVNYIGKLLKKQFGLPWIADFQDPWTQVDYYERLLLTKIADRKHKSMEQEIFATADALVTVSEQWRRDLVRIGARNTHCIPLGFDPADYQNLPTPTQDTYTLVHSGLVGKDRVPHSLLACLAQMKAEIPKFSEKFRLIFVGQTDISLEAAVKALALEDLVQLRGECSRQEAIRLCAEATALLLLLNDAPNA